MNRKIIIILSSVLLFFGCVSGDKYNTYRLDGVPLNHKSYFVYIGWIFTTDDDEISQELKVINKSDNTEKYMVFDFAIGENILESNDRGWIWGEPYTLWINFPVHDAKKITVNKLTFRSKNKVIDIRNNIGVYFTKNPKSDSSFSEEELINFRNSGIIDVNNLNNESRIIESIQFRYDNVDVLFKKDRFFTIECDITFDSEIEGVEPENYGFAAKFNRIKYTEESISLLLYLFLKIYF